MNSKYILVFAAAFLPAFLAAENPPATVWAWVRLVGWSTLQGVIALKALNTPTQKDFATEPTKPNP